MATCMVGRLFIRLRTGAAHQLQAVFAPGVNDPGHGKGAGGQREKAFAVLDDQPQGSPRRIRAEEAPVHPATHGLLRMALSREP